MFDVEHDPHANLLRITVKGFWKPEDIPAFAMAVDTEARKAHAGGGDFDVIVDSLEFPVQADGVADLLAEIMPRGIALTSGRAAVVVGSQLNKLQAERTLVHPRVRVFRSLETAWTWLGEDD